jgi:predicted nucleic acid-binding protein
MIVHAARTVNAAVLYSEDMAHGVTVAGVTVRNPFAGI